MVRVSYPVQAGISLHSSLTAVSWDLHQILIYDYTSGYAAIIRTLNLALLTVHVESAVVTFLLKCRLNR